eukprot:Sspe_Gene.49261::Locus_26341_Transcript_1_1_Confidence_1.000_Length_4185::g.49261::m.49261
MGSGRRPRTVQQLHPAMEWEDAYECSMADWVGYGWETSPVRVTVFFVPTPSIVGDFTVRAVFDADYTHRVHTTTLLQQYGVLTVQQADVLPNPWPLQGSNITILFRITTTGATIGGETVSIPREYLAADQPVAWASSRQSPLTPCNLTVSDAVCHLYVDDSPDGTSDLHWGLQQTELLVSFTPNTTTVGPLDLQVVFGADYFDTVTVSPNVTVGGQVRVVSQTAVPYMVRHDMLLTEDLVTLTFALRGSGKSVGGERVLFPESKVGVHGVKWSLDGATKKACPLRNHYYMCNVEGDGVRWDHEETTTLFFHATPEKETV